jgi:hypothetical protein
MRCGLWRLGHSIYFKFVLFSLKKASYKYYRNENIALLENAKCISAVQVANRGSYSVDK